MPERRRCKFCGREGSRLQEIRTPLLDMPNGYQCAHPIACIRRQEQLGQWHGVRVLYRQDPDGTRWTIRRAAPKSPFWTLSYEYRHIHATSTHPSVADAKKHCDDLIASWAARSLRDYAETRR